MQRCAELNKLVVYTCDAVHSIAAFSELLCVICDLDTVFDMLGSAAPLPPVRRHTENVKGSRGFLDYDHLPSSQGIVHGYLDCKQGKKPQNTTHACMKEYCGAQTS